MEAALTPSFIFDGPRRARPDEWRESHRLAAVCFSDQDELGDEPAGPPRPTPGETYVIAADGRLVSQISIFFTPLQIYNATVRVGSIGGVCTHPQYRGHGLASRLMEYCTARLAQGGARLMVISGGRGLYRRLGNVPMGRFAAFALPGGGGPGLTANVRLRPAGPADAALCGRLYAAEPVHFRRSPLAFARRFQPHAIGFHAEDWIVEWEGQAAAYLLLNVPWDHMDEPGMPVRCIFEYAGSRLALAGALAQAARQPGIREVQAPIPWQDGDLIYLLAQSCGRPGVTSLPDHTIRVINFPGLMADLKAYVRARLSPTLRRGLRFEQSGPLLAAGGEDRCVIARGADRLELDGADLTRLVVGDSEGSALPRLPGALAEVVPALFPLPAFFTGVDYH